MALAAVHPDSCWYQPPTAQRPPDNHRSDFVRHHDERHFDHRSKDDESSGHHELPEELHGLPCQTEQRVLHTAVCARIRHQFYRLIENVTVRYSEAFYRAIDNVSDNLT